MRSGRYGLGGTGVSQSGVICWIEHKLGLRRYWERVGGEPDPARFREVHEAYLTLTDAARRRSYDVDVGRASSQTPGPLEESPVAPTTILDDFESVTPPLGEMLDHVAQNFFGFRQKSGGPHRRLVLEIVLSREEAMAGGMLPFEVPSYEPCPRCRGGTLMLGLCPLCHGYGLLEGGRKITLGIPSGIRSGSRYQVALDSAGGNLTLDVTVLIA